MQSMQTKAITGFGWSFVGNAGMIVLVSISEFFRVGVYMEMKRIALERIDRYCHAG